MNLLLVKIDDVLAWIKPEVVADAVIIDSYRRTLTFASGELGDAPNTCVCKEKPIGPFGLSLFSFASFAK